MIRTLIVCLTGCALAGALVAAQSPQSPAPQAPLVFRSAANVVHLDVSVLDKNREPVHGLTAADFTVLEDGAPQPITTFSAIEIPNVDPPPAVWMREVPPDVHSNSLGDGRLLVIVMDDATVPNDVATIAKAKDIGRQVVDKLGPSDLAAVVFTNDNRHTQDFTNDRALLLHAINAFTGGVSSYTFGHDIIAESTGAVAPITVDTDTQLRLSSIGTLESVADYLAAVPQRRKSVIYVSVGVPVDPSLVAGPVLASGAQDNAVLNKETQQQIFDQMRALFRQAQKANVTIYSVNPGYGLLEGFISRTLLSRGMSIDGANALARQSSAATLDFLNAASENTGGVAAVATNDFAPVIEQMYRENGSYYLVGYDPGNHKTDGAFRRVEVRVNRPGVTVHTRTGYFAEKTGGASTKKPIETPAVVKAISGLLPNPDVPMRVALAPFAAAGTTDGKMATLAIALEMEEPEPASRVTQEIELQANAFGPEGQSKGAMAQHATLVLRGAAAGGSAEGTVSYEVLGTLSLPPGRYSLRLASHNKDLDKTGSVYTDVEIPNFAATPVSLSGVVLDVAPGLAVAPRDAMQTLIPVVPTTLREFDSANQVTAFMRVYQGGKSSLAPVTMHMRILNDHDVMEVDRQETLAASQFVSRAADYRAVLPTSRLTPGAHLLRLEATVGTTTMRRDVPFTMK